MKEQIKLAELLEGHSEQESRIILRKFYTEHYQVRKYNPINGKKIWVQLLSMNPKFVRGLDVGCGTGIGLSMARNCGYNVWGFDIADISNRWEENGVKDRCLVASATHFPFRDNSFDFVMSSDVLEHIPELDILPVLKEIYRVASRVVLIVVALNYEKELIQGDIYSHITVKPSSWWIDKFEEVGFVNPTHSFNDHHVMSWLTKIKQ